MTEKYRYVLQKPARLIYSSVTEKSAPRGVNNAIPKYSATFGISEDDFKALCEIMKKAIVGATGQFSNPSDYYLACQSGEVAAQRVLAKAELDAAGKSSDEAFKIKEKAESRAKTYREYAGILNASSQFAVALSKQDGNKVIDLNIDDTQVLTAAGKELFYPGAFVACRVELRGYKRKNLDSRDGVTAFLQHVLHVHNGERFGSGPASGASVFGAQFGSYSDYDPTAMAPDLDADDTTF